MWLLLLLRTRIEPQPQLQPQLQPQPTIPSVFVALLDGADWSLSSLTLQDGIETMVQYGYPYPTSFYNPVPGYPFKVACQRMVAVGTPLGAL